MTDTTTTEAPAEEQQGLIVNLDLTPEQVEQLPELGRVQVVFDLSLEDGKVALAEAGAELKIDALAVANMGEVFARLGDLASGVFGQSPQATFGVAGLPNAQVAFAVRGIAVTSRDLIAEVERGIGQELLEAGVPHEALEAAGVW